MIDDKALCHAKVAMHKAQKIARGLNWNLRYRHGYNLRLNDPVQRLFDAEDEIANAIDRLRLERYRLRDAIAQEVKMSIIKEQRRKLVRALHKERTKGRNE